jgi:hypothetical protein
VASKICLGNAADVNGLPCATTGGVLFNDEDAFTRVVLIEGFEEWKWTCSNDDAIEIRCEEREGEEQEEQTVHGFS